MFELLPNCLWSLGFFLIGVMLYLFLKRPRGSPKYIRRLSSDELAMDRNPVSGGIRVYAECPSCRARIYMPLRELTRGTRRTCSNCGAKVTVTRKDDSIAVEAGVSDMERVLHCEVCHRPLLNLGTGGPPFLSAGALLDTKAVIDGHEGPGDECMRCGRIYCTSCARKDTTCICGSDAFRIVRLVYSDPPSDGESSASATQTRFRS